MRKTREEKAITLIALIITIVVLLILAVVAINAVTGDGIIQHATNAKTAYEKAQAEENSMISYYEKYLESQGGADIWDGETKEKPEIKEGDWYIYNCNQLKFFADFVNGELTEEQKNGLEITEETTVYLMSNLDLGARQENGELTSGSEWTPIGIDSDTSFEGTFEGNNHYIKGIYVNDEDGFAGIFGYSTNAINNLIVKDGYIEADGRCVGGIVGRGEILVNCHNINTTVKQNLEVKIGGIAGQALSAENCTNTGTVIGNSERELENSIGGIIGLLANDGYVKNCKNSGNITGMGERVGGIIGNKNTPSNISGEVEEIGVYSCVNTGNVKGKGCVAGIIGFVSADGKYNYLKLTNCYNTGNISGEYDIGGIIGLLDGTKSEIKACYNIGKIEGTNSESKGNIIGFLDDGATGEIEEDKCYYLAETTDSTTGAMVESEMKTKAFANLLNTATTTGAWVGNDGQYPKLSWE